MPASRIFYRTVEEDQELSVVERLCTLPDRFLVIDSITVEAANAASCQLLVSGQPFFLPITLTSAGTVHIPFPDGLVVYSTGFPLVPVGSLSVYSDLGTFNITVTWHYRAING